MDSRCEQRDGSARIVNRCDTGNRWPLLATSSLAIVVRLSVKGPFQASDGDVGSQFLRIGSVGTVHDLPDELREGAGFGRCSSPGGKNRPKIDPRQLPILQNDLYCAIANFGREHPFGDNRETGLRKDGGAQTLGGADAQPPLQRDGNLRPVALKGPGRTTARLIANNGLVPGDG
jgi:hypothetical protein